MMYPENLWPGRLPGVLRCVLGVDVEHRRPTKTLAVLLCMTVLVGVLPAQDQPTPDGQKAVLDSHGKVDLNDFTAPRSTTLKVGDKVKTENCASATLTAPGSKGSVAANSSVVFNGKQVQLMDGVVTVTTTAGMASQAGSYAIQPEGTTENKYEIRKNGSAISVQALKGTVTVTGEGKTVNVAEGKTESFTSTGEPNPEKKHWVPCKGFWYGVAGAGAAAAIIAGVAGQGGGNALSPSIP